jgi:hypothetical protein
MRNRILFDNDSHYHTGFLFPATSGSQMATRCCFCRAYCSELEL